MEPLPHLPIPSRTDDLLALFERQGKITESPSGCLIWNGPVFRHGGYGRFYVPSTEPRLAGRSYRAHRVAYAWEHGDPGDAVLDHVCHDPLECFDTTEWCVHRRCVNVDHLAPTTRGENVRRGIPGSPLWHPLGNSLKQTCVHGHEFTDENTYINPRGERQCRTCLKEASRRYVAANRERINSDRREKRVRVVHEERPCENCGMPFAPQRSDGRYCDRRPCVLARQRENRLKRLGRA